MSRISKVTAREILDSRDTPTLEVTVILEDATKGTFCVPSGLSTGKYEAKELRDGDKDRYDGKGVLKACKNVEEIISPMLKGKDPQDQQELDSLMIEKDNTQDKSNLGANAILGVSGAIAKAFAKSSKTSLFEYISTLSQNKSLTIPYIMFNILNGGKHADFNVDFQEFMVIPKDKSFSNNMECAFEIYQNLKDLLEENNMSTLIGDEGGFAPKLSSNEEAMELISKATKKVKPSFDVAYGIDAAANSFKQESSFKVEGKNMTWEELSQIYIGLNLKYDLETLEDPFGEDDWESWQFLMEKIGDKMKIVGDDLIVTNPKRLDMAIEKGACNAVIIKPNQIGTVTESIEVIKKAKASGFKIVVSHRSGETNDDFIADFAVGVGADYAKLGAPARGERIAKYNRLLKIEQELA